MTTQTGFKKEAKEAMGVFYPTGYLVAVFASMADAETARGVLEQQGHPPNSTVLMSGQEFVELSDNLHKDASTWQTVLSKISKAVGTEELHLENDLKAARAGAAFLAVECETQESGQLIFNQLKSLSPLAMRRYSPLTIDRMI